MKHQYELNSGRDIDLPSCVAHGGVSVTFVHPNNLRRRLEHTDEIISLLDLQEADLPEPCTEASLIYRYETTDTAKEVQLAATIEFDAPDDPSYRQMWQSHLRHFLDKELAKNNIDTAKLDHHHATLYAQLDDTYATQFSFVENTSNYSVEMRLERISTLMSSQTIHNNSIEPDYFESHTNLHDVSDTAPYELVRRFTHQWATALSSVKKSFGPLESVSGISTFVINVPERVETTAPPDESEKSAYELALTDPSRPTTTFEDVGGAFSVKEQLRLKALAFTHADLARLYGIQNSGFLLHGPAGTGKTSLVEAFANEIRAELREFSSTDIVSKWVGQSGKKAAEIFDDAKSITHPLVLFFDEFDSLAPKGDSGTTERRDVKNIFKREMTELAKKNPNIIIAAASNEDPGNFDEALIRAGRLEPLYVAAPTEAERAEIWHIKLTQLADTLPPMTRGEQEDIAYPYNANPSILAERSDTLTGADIEQVLQRVKVQKFLEAVNTGMPMPIVEADIIRAINAYQKP